VTRCGDVAAFPSRCCFQVIYFISNIFFSLPTQPHPRARVETVRLTRAVKNVWAALTGGELESNDVEADFGGAFGRD
jgi:hypothetical protein